MSRLTIVLAAALALAPLAAAQRGAGGPAHFGSHFRGARLGAPWYGHHRFNYRRGYYLGDLAYYYDDYPFEPAALDAAPQIVVVQPQVGAEASPQSKAAPLLIELEGDHYVRYGGIAPSTDRNPPADGQPEREVKAARDSVAAASTRSLSYGKAAQSGAREMHSTASEPSSGQLAPTVLVYRDGRREEIPDYAIIGRVLYAHSIADDQLGQGMKSIQLSALDLPATMKANRENGVNFILPAGPNEVVTRP